jgi:hypothetical protein
MGSWCGDVVLRRGSETVVDLFLIKCNKSYLIIFDLAQEYPCFILKQITGTGDLDVFARTDGHLTGVLP